MPRTIRLVVCLALLVGTVPAAAQEPKLDTTLPAQLFEPGIGPTPFFTVEGATVLDRGLYGLSFYMNYQRRPFREANVSGSTIGDDRWAVDDQVSADLVFAYGVYHRLQVGAALPLSLSLTNSRQTGNCPGGQEKCPSGGGVGDLRLEGKVVLWSRHGETQGMAVAAAPILTIPLDPSGYASSGDATERKFLGERYPTFRPRVTAEFTQGPLFAAADLGVILRASSTYLGETLSHQLTYGAAVGYDLGRKIVVRPVIEISGRHGFDNYQDTAPLEIAGGVKIIIARMWEVAVGGGGGIIGGIGAPQARGFVGVAFNPDFRDRDHDRIPDVHDDCPDQPEDRDGFRDIDGCPEPDNDGDAIPDAQDKCPNEPEDFDTFQDEDGCPDLDNDHDGIPDITDACPFEPEDGQKPKPADGCPLDKTDTDGDGIMDNVDRCPEEAEDMDGFEDGDGCPDVDNDGDGVPDQFDQCPNEAEDMDGFEDDDGCPDPDNDKDGVLDKEDKCPNEPETINGYRDEDGCPDKGEPKVVLNDKANRIELREAIRFRERGTEIVVAPASHPLLTQLAQLLRGHTEITKLKVAANGAANDSPPTIARRASAVRMFLVGRGIAEDRLVAALGASGAPHASIDLVIVERKGKKGAAATEQEEPKEAPKAEPGEEGAAPE